MVSMVHSAFVSPVVSSTGCLNVRDGGWCLEVHQLSSTNMVYLLQMNANILQFLYRRFFRYHEDVSGFQLRKVNRSNLVERKLNWRKAAEFFHVEIHSARKVPLEANWMRYFCCNYVNIYSVFERITFCDSHVKY